MTNFNNRKKDSFFAGVDALSVCLYLLILLLGCLSITSATFNPESLDVFAFSHNYIKQIVWASLALLVGVAVLLVDSNFFHKLAYPLYGFGICLLLLALFFGREVNGAKAWFEFGSIRLQPAEIVKITTSLALARVMSEAGFSFKSASSLIRAGGLLALPLLIIVLQNDTGSGVVFSSMLFVFYREGLSRWVVFPPLFFIALFICSFVFEPTLLLSGALLICTLLDAYFSREYKNHLIFLASILLSTISLMLLPNMFWGGEMSSFSALMISLIFALPLVLFSAFLRQLAYRLYLSGFLAVTAILLPITNYIFNNILRPHQQNRIMSFLGIISDPLGVDYNVNQSKIAIGSGAVLGKGFLESTQIRYGFVPERHTDFIFCVLAEEWGFVGSSLLLLAYMALILRLMWMGERQNASFGRIYCYAVAAILLFHILVNIGMTIGLLPVMGIPLPFMSYGGSSLLAFTIMLFIAIRFDASRTESIAY